MSGEFAGYALDETLDAEDDRFAYRSGSMSDAEAYELGVIDELGFYNHLPMFGQLPRQHKRANSEAMSLSGTMRRLGAALNKLKDGK
jgi:hypothetical protein